MSLEIVEKNLNEINSLSEKYDELLEEKRKLEISIEKLKEGYKEDDKDVFSKSNQRMMEVNKNLQRIKERVYELSEGIKKEISMEMENAG